MAGNIKTYFIEAVDWFDYVPKVTLRLDWTHSESADRDHYTIRHSGGDPFLDPDADPDDTTTNNYYELEVDADATGTWIFLVRCVDTDGNEEGNISCLAWVYLVDGQESAIPAEPRNVKVDPIAGGKLRVSWLYTPWQEQNGPGAAHEGRIYGDGGTGTMDFSSPVATVAMSNPTEEDSFSWDSGVLSDGTFYGYVVRVATAAHPGGIETQNTDVHYGTPDSDVPTTPVLDAKII